LAPEFAKHAWTDDGIRTSLFCQNQKPLEIMKRIIAGIDFSDVTDAVVAAARKQAVAFGAEIDLLHVIAPEPAFVGYAAYAYPGPDQREEELGQEKDRMRQMVDELNNGGIVARGLMKEDQTVRGIRSHLEETQADLLVIGNHDHGLLSSLLLGSITDDVVRHTRIPVLVVPAGKSEE
jgi:nucleotide-binding universal stress UspA family protein